MYNYLCNKYFRDLDAFNRELVPHKLIFFNDVKVSSFFELLNKLTYNLDSSTSNYRWGKRYFNPEYKDFKWITSNNKKITVPVWNVNSHSYENKEINALFSDLHIKNHFLSSFKKNRKIKYFYKLTDNEKNELRNHNLALSNIYRVDGKTFGSSQMLNTDILLIDIDNYEERSSLETLSMFLDFVNLKVKDLIYIEQNAFTGGIHTALKLPHKITNQEFYSNFMSYLMKNDIRIECNFVNNILRFPLSFEYVAIKKDENILNEKEFISKQYWEDTYTNFINNMNWNICNSELINNFILKEHNKEEEKIDPYENYWKTKKHIIQRATKNKKFNANRFDFYKITEGNRYNTMSKLVPFCKMQGYTLEETANIIREQNVSSKDLNKWSQNKLINNIRKFYNKCPEQMFHINKSFSGFVSNIPNLPEKTLAFLNSKDFGKYITERFIQNYIKERNKHSFCIKQLSKEKEEILHQVIPYIVMEIIGRMFYDISNEKKFIKGINEELGFQLSDSHLKAIQDDVILNLGIDSPLAKTSLQYLKKAILASLNLQEIQYKNRKRNWMLGSCKSYRIKSLYDIINMLKHLYNSLYQITYKELIKDNKLLISYILLIENIGLESIDEKIDIPKYIT